MHSTVGYMNLAVNKAAVSPGCGISLASSRKLCD
jgi:hypothetical protein